MRRWVALGAVAATLTLVACGGDGDESLGPTATVPTATTTPDPYAVPPVIDEAYVNRVLAGLDQVVGDAVRRVVRNRQLDEEVFYKLKAVAAGDSFQLKLDSLQGDLMAGLSTYSETPGNKRTTVMRLVSVAPQCIFVEVSKDFTEVNRSGQPNISTQWIALVPLDRSRDPSGYNPTGWMFIYDGFQEDRSQPPDPCAQVS